MGKIYEITLKIFIDKTNTSTKLNEPIDLLLKENSSLTLSSC